MEVKWKVALYVDERANQEQRGALTQIFSGQSGGHLANLAPLASPRPHRYAERCGRGVAMQAFRLVPGSAQTRTTSPC